MLTQKGFTLTELIITISILSILAMIAIPQYNNYKTISNNSSALSDLYEMKMTQALLYAELGCYGELPVSTGDGNKKTVTSKLSGLTHLVQISKDNMIYSVVGNINNNNDHKSFIIVSKHKNGNVTYACDSDSETVYKNNTGNFGDPDKNLTGNEISDSIKGINQLKSSDGWEIK